MTDDADPTALPRLLDMYGIVIPDSDMDGVVAAYGTLSQAAGRVLTATPDEVDIPVLYDPSAT